MATVINHSLYSCRPKVKEADATKWIHENAELLPEKLLELVHQAERDLPANSKGPSKAFVILGKDSSALHYLHLVGAEWGDLPDPSKAYTNKKDLTRNLTLRLQVDGTEQIIDLHLDDVIPFPTPRGTYLKGSNEQVFKPELIQKPGIFPVNLDEINPGNPAANGILWHNNNGSFLQTKDNLTVIYRSLNPTNRSDSNRLNCPVQIPKQAWGEFDRALAQVRGDTKRLKTDSYPELFKAYCRAYPGNERNPNRNGIFTYWVRGLSRIQVPQGEWSKRTDRLGYSELSESRAWSLKNSVIAEKMINDLEERMDDDPPQAEFLEYNSTARGCIRTGSDLIAAIIAEKLQGTMDKLSHDLSTDPSRNLQNIIKEKWAPLTWKLSKALNFSRSDDKTNRSQSTHKSNIDCFAQKNKVFRSLAVFGQKAADEGEISKAQQSYCSRTDQPFWGSQTQEGSNVGAEMHVPAFLHVNPKTGEVLTPIGTQNPDGSTTINYLGHEDLEILYAELAAKGSGLYRGKIDKLEPNASCPLYLFDKVVDVVRPSEITHFFACDPDEYLMHIARLMPFASQNAMERLPMTMAFQQSGGRSYGSRASDNLSASQAESAKVIALSDSYVAPVTGIITDIKSNGEESTIVITDDQGDSHTMSYLSQVSNTYGYPTGYKCLFTAGQAIEKDQPILVPNGVSGNSMETLGAYLTVPAVTAILSSGTEDEVPVSWGKIASGDFISLEYNTHDINFKEGDFVLNVAHLGKVIQPGSTILGWQNGKPIIATDDDRGILTGINFKNTEGETNYGVNLSEQATADLASYADTLARSTIATVLKGIHPEFERIALGWTYEDLMQCKENGFDPREQFEAATYYVNIGKDPEGNDTWAQKQITYQDLIAGSPKYAELLNDLVERTPETGIRFGKFGETVPTTLEIRLNHEHNNLIELIKNITQTQIKIPPLASGLSFQIVNEYNMRPGGKTSETGIKGTISGHHPKNMGFHLVKQPDGSMRATYVDIHITEHAIIARGAAGDLRQLGSGPKSQEAKIRLCAPDGSYHNAVASVGEGEFINHVASTDKRNFHGGHTAQPGPTDYRTKGKAPSNLDPATANIIPGTTNVIGYTEGSRSSDSFNDYQPGMN